MTQHGLACRHVKSHLSKLDNLKCGSLPVYWLFQISFLPFESSSPITVQGTGLSKIGFAKQLLEIHEDPSPEKKNGEELESYADLMYYVSKMSKFSLYL
jgi:hypothetical protein